MDIQLTDLTVDPSGRLLLDGLPFSPGQHVDVVIRVHGEKESPADLRGSVLHYDRPCEPVSNDNWDADS